MTVRPILIAGCLSLAAAAAAQNVPAAGPVREGNAPAARADAAPVVRDIRGVDAAAEYRIGPEDVLDVQVWKNPELSRTVPVRPDGRISLTLVNDIQAAGLTTAELRQQITGRLAEYVPNAEVSVIVREVHSVKVSVLGAVKMPGHYEVKSASTVLDMLARAQGLTEFARGDEIKVSRRNGDKTDVLSFNYRRAAEGKDPNFDVRPGDIIYVP